MEDEYAENKEFIPYTENCYLKFCSGTGPVSSESAFKLPFVV